MQPGMEDTVIENIDGVPVIRIRKELWKNPRTPVREKRPIWTSDEVIRMIQIIKDKNILSLLYGGKYRRNDVFKVVAANLRRMGYNRTAEQISTKWKHLRLTYAHAKAELKSGISTAGQECAFYEQMDDLLGDRLHIVGIDAPETIGHEEMVQEYMIEVQEPQSDLSQMEFTQDMESETAEETSPPKNIKKRRMYSMSCPRTTASWSSLAKRPLFRVHRNFDQKPRATCHQQTDKCFQNLQLMEDHSQRQGTTPDRGLTPEARHEQTRNGVSVSNPPGRFRKSNEGTYSNALKNFTKEWELMMIRVAEKEREQDRLEKEKEKMEQRRWEERLIEAQSEAMTKANSEFLSGLKGLFDELKN
ncbi:uncharacterized protein LOC128983113 isoform X2 [Macrosteles quadrilineatus]|uniref:uncharacterized protein LOC128983113 isoform X2 n=1 Tax=Macrosteles quadrilineatus TaxID=74068 RepID=UPI0023E14FFB|nr:uncharacterized protein LOC128983113 isoform X2 [Macrosteles quadrilineatus]